jgi:hypothetical protein
MKGQEDGKIIIKTKTKMTLDKLPTPLTPGHQMPYNMRVERQMLLLKHFHYCTSHDSK